MTECCKDLFATLNKYDQDSPEFGKEDVLNVVSFILSWPHRQCRCIFREQQNLARLEDQLQFFLSTAVENIAQLDELSDTKGDEGRSRTKARDTLWTLQEKEKIFLAVAKVFQLHFPLYQARKFPLLQKTVSESSPAKYCDVNEGEIPEALLINIAHFCDKGGLTAIREAFHHAEHSTFPFPLAHWLINIVTQLRVWFSIQAIMKYIIPLRRPVIRYLCKLTDKDLRHPDGRAMADAMWSAVKGPVESGPIFDRDSMDLAFKYFTSSTLTVRLAGLSQITNQVHMFLEMFQNESLGELDSMCTELSHWLVENRIVEHVFGPNLHVELLKQSQVILNFLARESCLTTQHLDCMWAAAQLKHASRYVHDLLTVLTKHMDMQSIIYLLELVSKMAPSGHTRQSLYLASLLTRITWSAESSSDGGQSVAHANSPIQATLSASSASAAVAAAIQRKFSQGAGSLSHSSSRSGSLSDLSFQGDDRDLPDQSPRKFTNVPRSDVKVPVGVLGQRTNLQDLRQQFSSEEGVFSVDQDKGDDVDIDSTSCTNSHGSSFSERRDLDDFEGEDIGDELTQFKTVAALRNVQGDSDTQMSVAFDLSSVCDEGKTLLWDLVQDHNAIHMEDGLMQEAERLLYQLICYSGEKKIRMRFIEGCITNLANNKSTVMSLRLIPKLLGSFQQFLNIEDSGPHWVTSWANRELNMMSLFFKNLQQYMNSDSEGKTSGVTLYSHNDEVKTRLQFLSSVYSNELSPLDFRLSCEQVDILWSCLVCDSCCSDEALDWFVQQARSKDLHALDLDTLKYIFAEKLPTLAPDQFSLTALLLLQQLYKLFQYTISKPRLSSTKMCGLDQLWNVALKARNSKVSEEAIGYLNSLYINADGGSLKFEEEFIQRCMKSIGEASQQLTKEQGYNLLIMERGLLLLKSHIEAFKKRFAFHLHLWSLEGNGITSHQQKPVRSVEKNYPIRVLCQPAGLSDKGTFEMNSTDLVADLRAEVTHWCKKLREKQQQFGSASQHSLLSPISHQLNPPFRLISQGHELTPDLDEKSLADVGFKDLQLVFVSVGATRRENYQDGSQIPSSSLPTPERNKTPMILLLQKEHFEQFFSFLELLDNLKVQTSESSGMDTGNIMEDTHKSISEKEQGDVSLPERLQPREKRKKVFAQDTQVHHLCQIIWDLLMLLLTNPTILNNLKYFGQTPNDEESLSRISSDSSEIEDSSEVDWNMLLDSQFPHKLLYSLQVVDQIKSSSKDMKNSSSDDSMSSDSEFSDMDDDEYAKQNMTNLCSWGRHFVEKGGLKHLCDILMSGCLEAKVGSPWTFWQQECLAFLLKLICEFGTMKMDSEDNGHESEEVFESSLTQQMQRNIQRKDGEFRVRYKSTDKEETIFIKCLSQHMISMIDVESLLDKLLCISYEAALPIHGAPGKTTKGSQVVHHAVSLLVSWAYTDVRVSKSLLQQKNFKRWLQQLVLLAQEGSVRFEASRGLYRLSLIKENSCLTELMNALLDFLPLAQSLRMRERADRPNEPCAREYFSILCRLVDGLPTKVGEEEGSGVDLNSLAKLLAKYITSHKAKQSSGHEEEGLNGLLKLCTAVIRHDPQFKSSPAGLEFLKQVFHRCLFDMPTDCRDKSNVPWCRSKSARNAAFDLLLEMSRTCAKNFCELQSLLIKQHSSDSSSGRHSSYGWHYWPHDNGRSPYGLVGVINLGATCYMASCVQQLYMMPQARAAILNAKVTGEGRYDALLRELQRMFCFLLKSERKAYNPRTFCKTYTMDKQPLNTGEQKDMTEFFTDLISKMEEMSPSLKELVRDLFYGLLTNNVVSLDCSHVSKTKEDFYSVRCTVADMKNLYESLDEVTVKDTLDGDNMYTCSQCGKKVRAEKRACFKVLPRILCFNTMRYTFNMVTMMKEKVNTHFSFPLHLNMAPYSEEYLMGEKIDEDPEKDPSYWYTLVGVVVHTGTAEGGHYYSFIRDRTAQEADKWFLFNDAEVKPFDPAQIASECFGGEMMTKTYDAVTEKFMDFSFEKTHSAYMLFYERSEPGKQPMYDSPKITASNEYTEWIWKDNIQFLHDKHIFDTSYFNFMWNLCCGVSTGMGDSDEVMLSNIKLSVSFLLETLIHAKEKPLLKNWVELLMDQFERSAAACEWFLNCMAEDDWWLQQGFIKCPVPNIRQMLARLCIHVLQLVRPSQLRFYSQSTDDEMDSDSDDAASSSCVTRFIKTVLGMLEQNIRSHIKNMSEYFWLIHQFAHFGDEERQFLLSIDAITTMVNFYLGIKNSDSHNESGTNADDGDDVDEEDEVVPVLPDDKYHHVTSLEKMVTVLVMLTEESRGERHLYLSKNDMAALTGAKGFPFLYQAIKDGINLRHTANLIFSLCRFNVRLAENIISMVISSVQKLPPEQSQSFFKLLSMLTEVQERPSGLPSFTSLTLARIWEAAEYNAALCIDWLTCITPKSKMAHQWVLDNMDKWVEKFLIADNSLRIRNASAYLLVALVPNSHFRQGFRSRSFSVPQKDIQFSDDAKAVLHKIYETLLGLLGRARNYCDRSLHGTTKLVSYFAVLNYCLVSRQEKEMFTSHSNELWRLFHPLMSEPSIPVHPNKQALLIFWYHACVGCNENVEFITGNAHVSANIPLNYILSSDEHEVLTFNRSVLPAYYGLLRLCCEHSRVFTRQLAVHSNMKWAFENLTPRINHYPQAVDELFKLMRLFAGKGETDLTPEEETACATFRKNTIVLYLNCLDGGAAWTTLISAFKILLQTEEDRLIVAVSQGILTLSDAFTTLHMMYHEATACHVTGDMTEVLTILQNILVCCRSHMDKPEVRSSILGWSERMDIAHKLLSLMNSYTPKDVRKSCLDVLNAMLPLYASDCTENLIGFIQQCHLKWHRATQPAILGPYFPRRHAKVIVSTKSVPRPAHPELNMYLSPSFFEAPKGIDEAYDNLLNEYFYSYHHYVDKLLRFGFNQDKVHDAVISCSCLLAIEGIPLHFTFFSKLWTEIYQKSSDNTKYKNCIKRLCQHSEFIEYIDVLLLDERESLNTREIYSFLTCFFPRVHDQALMNQWANLVHTIEATIIAEKSVAENAGEAELSQMAWRLTGELRALSLLFSVSPPDKAEISNLLQPSLVALLSVCKAHQKSKQEKHFRKNSNESEPKKSDEQKHSSTEDEDEPVKKKKRTKSEESNSPKSDHTSSPGPSDKSHTREHSEEGAKSSSQKVPSKTQQVLPRQRPLDCVDILAKALESAISKVPK